jgi:hypothetical protein
MGGAVVSEKMSAREEYWAEAVGLALDDMGKWSLFAPEEIKELGRALAVSADNQSIAFGWDIASGNLAAARRREEDSLRAELRRERAKVTCRHCNGYGSTRTQGPYHSVSSSCFKCNGEGRHDP